MIVNKTVQISGNLKDEGLSYRLCPSDEFSNGQWCVSVSNIAFRSEQPLNALCTLSTNFCVHKKFSKSGEPEIYEEPFGTFELVTTREKKMTTKDLTPIWLKINRISDVLKLRFKNPFSNEDMKLDCTITALLLFQKI